jgi:hypothetical protein
MAVTTIKTQVMDSIKAALATISELKTVERIPATGLDMDVAPSPALLFYDLSEERSRRNRLAVGVLRVILLAFIPLVMNDFNEAGSLADVIQGRVHTVMNTHLLTGSPLISLINEISVLKEYPNDEYLVVIMQYDVTYEHNWGDAFSNAGY